MRNVLKKLMSTMLLILFIVFSGWCQNHRTESAQFPELSVELIKADLSEKNLLDTAYLSTFDYLEYLKNLPDTDEGFVTVGNPDVIKYFNYVYAKNILNSLVKLETCKDEELRKNMLFKLNIQLTNRPLSKQDLIFVYKYPDLDSVNKAKTI